MVNLGVRRMLTAILDDDVKVSYFCTRMTAEQYQSFSCTVLSLSAMMHSEVLSDENNFNSHDNVRGAGGGPKVKIIGTFRHTLALAPKNSACRSRSK